ncbi:MAG: hypothetical protein ACE5HV_16750 [Acidobacteriota bacterium]
MGASRLFGRRLAGISHHLPTAVVLLSLAIAGLAGATQADDPVRPSPWIESRAPEAFGASASEPLRQWGASYRVDATVLLPLGLFSIPITTREGVGFGSFGVHDYLNARNESRRAFEFFAASLPERARGLNRLGFLREVTSFVDGGAVWTAYFGVISATREKSREEAEKVLDKEIETQPFSIIDGLINPSEATNGVTKFELSGRWETAADLYAEVQPHMQGYSPDYTREIPNQDGRAYRQPLAFLGGLQASLQAVAATVTAGENPKKLRQRYVHNGTVFRFEVDDIDRDEGQGRKFVASGWVISPKQVRRIHYKVRDSKNHQVDHFWVWVELPPASKETTLDEPIVPIAFQLKPRAFLRLRAVRVGS